MITLEKDEPKLTNTYFIRHTEKLGISDVAVSELYSQDKIFIHFPDCKPDDPETPDKESLNPVDYKLPQSAAPSNIKILNELGNKGGIVWAEYYTEKEFIIIGEAAPQEPKVEGKFFWDPKKYPARKGKPAVLKVIQLQNVKKIKRGKFMSLEVSRPRQGTLRHWHAVGNKLESIYYEKHFEKDFSNLIPAEQEMACLEFLRNQKSFPKIPQLRYLLLPPGRTMENVDIYGLSNDNKKIFAQVTYLEESETTKFKHKVDKLKNYNYNHSYLLMFCNRNRLDCPDVDKKDNILYIQLNIVEKWLKQPGQKDFADRLFETVTASHYEN